MAQSSYYSGDLAAINRGRTADAAVDAADNASFRNYLAAIAQNRTRESLGNRELGIREALGTGELGLRRDLGTADIGLRRELGTGELDLGRRRIGETAADRGLRRELGLGALTQEGDQFAKDLEFRLKELNETTRLKQAEIDAYKMYLQQGGAADWRADRDARRAEEEKLALQSEAQVIANRLSALALESTKGKEIPGWWDTNAERAAAFTNNPAFQGEIVQGVLNAQPVGDAAMVEFDPVQTRFIPNRLQFPRVSVATPGINPNTPSPVFPAGGMSLFQQIQAERNRGR